jgi:uncharacterized phage-associated protein
MVELAGRDGLSLTNLSLQKLLYFAHGYFLIRQRLPLVSGHFEAWTYGPVHPAVYHAFKGAGDRPITAPATARNVMSGEERAIPVLEVFEVDEVLREVLRSLGRLSAGRLVDISHAPRGPWAQVVDKARTSVSLGMRISDKVTLEYFKHHKVAVGAESSIGEPDEDTPLV